MPLNIIQFQAHHHYRRDHIFDHNTETNYGKNTLKNKRFYFPHLMDPNTTDSCINLVRLLKSSLLILWKTF
ncbi:MAG: hypothetical protein ACJAYN_003275 [Bermanella sp.]|jgi:hypothetical protein